MKTKFIEFGDDHGEVMRGILAVPDGKFKRGAIFVHGFERNATVEKKFRRMADELAQKGIVSLRFDFLGCGLSEGYFPKTTLKKRAAELLAALDAMHKEFGDLKINFVAHSMGGCSIAMEMEKLGPVIERVLLIAPALNQKDILRFYFVRETMAEKEPQTKIGWDNYLQYFNEDDFLGYCRSEKMLKKNFIEPGFFLDAKIFDASHSFDNISDRVLHIHGDNDPTVPLPSLNVVFPHRIIVRGGDHDLERPDFWDQWFERAVAFLAA